MPNIQVVNNAKVVQGEGLSLLKNKAYIALGRGNASWDTVIDTTGTFVSNQFFLAPSNAFASDVRLFESGNPSIEYVRNLDFLFDEDTGTVTRVGGGAISAGATVDVKYKAIGKLGVSATSLVSEIGRRRAQLSFLVRDEVSGTITVDGLKYSVSVNPTEYVLAQATFAISEASGETLRESALFFNTEATRTTVTGTETFSNDKIVLDTEVQAGTKNVTNVIIKTSDEVTTYVEGTDYILLPETSEVYRLESGNISVGEEVFVSYDKEDADYYIPADLDDSGILYVGQTYLAKTRDALGEYTEGFLLKLTR